MPRAARRGSEVLLEKMTPHVDKLFDALNTPVAEWSVANVASDRASRMLPKPVWALLAMGYLASVGMGIAADPTVFALTMLAI